MQKGTDEQLMEEVLNGASDPLGILYDRYKTILYNYFIRLTNDRPVSKDLLMTVFERLYKYRKSYNPEKKFKSWLFQIANNVVKDHLRHKKRTKTYSEVYDQGHEDNILKQIDMRERKDTLLLAVNKLDAVDRRVISMKYLLELNYQEIAEIEQISVNNARIRVCRSLKKLHTILSKSEI